MTQLPALYVDPSSIVDPATVPGLRYNRTTWWYEAPKGRSPVRCAASRRRGTYRLTAA